ncbi:peptidase S10 [soil metagenome]
MKTRRSAFFLALVAILASLAAAARADTEKPHPDADAASQVDADEPGKESGESGESDQGAEEAAKPDPDHEETSTTAGSIVIGGQPIDYDATAGTIPLTKRDGSTVASIFYIAYTRKNAAPPEERPIAFCFNGGPGSSSVWLHLGALGPRLVDLPGDGTQPAMPPFRLVDNAHSLLDVADLVFIDPVSTGYSRAKDPDEAKQFHGVEQDIESVGEFVRLYTTRNGRWGSPKFVMGESYGGLRAAGLAHHLQERYGMFLNGIALVSAVLDFRTLSPDAGSDLPYLAFLPTMTAVAFYHGTLDAERQQDFAKTMADVRSFARDHYLPALHRGAELPDADREKIATLLAAYTGLPRDVILDTDLRISPTFFRKELLRDKGIVIGRFDGRVTGTDPDRSGSSPTYDPSYNVVYGAFSSTLNAYVRGELEFESDLTYEILTSDVRPWNYSRYTNRFVNLSNQLSTAIKDNPFLQVFVATGHQDLATPHDAITYSLDHLPLAPELRDNIHVRQYEGGHMMYTLPQSLVSLKADLAEFVRDATVPDGDGDGERSDQDLDRDQE